MRIGFVKWPYSGSIIKSAWSLAQIPIMSLNSPPNTDVFDSFIDHINYVPANGSQFRTFLEIVVRESANNNIIFKDLNFGWCDFDNINEYDCITFPFKWPLHLENKHIKMLSEYKGKILIDGAWESWFFDEGNEIRDHLNMMYKCLDNHLNFDNVYLLTPVSFNDNQSLLNYQSYFHKMKIVTLDVYMILVWLRTINNGIKIYSDDYIKSNYKYDKDKDYLLCLGRARQYRLALYKFLADNKLIDEGFISTNMSPTTENKNRNYRDDYINKVFATADSYKLQQFCEIEELKNYVVDHEIREYPTEYFLYDNPYPPKTQDVYARSKYSIIAETMFQTDLGNAVWLTEKSWLPYVYGHPFVHVGMKNSLKRLKHLGFEPYTDFNIENDDQSPYGRFVDTCKIIENAKNFSYDSSLLEKILHNSSTFYNKSVYDSLVSNFVNQLN